MENKFFIDSSELSEIVVKENETLQLSLIFLDKAPDFHFCCHVEENGKLLANLIDFSSKSCNFSAEIYLDGISSSCDWSLSSYGRDKSLKNYAVSSFLSAKTNSIISLNGVADDESRVAFSGVSKIPHGAKKARARQDARVMVFNPKAKGIASPSLVIEENDLEASHAAIVGQIDPRQIFYLVSRGIEEQDARYLLALSYLRPTIMRLNDGEIKTQLLKRLEGGFSND